MKLTVIIPTYNEAMTIERVLEKVFAVPLDKEVIVIDDGSTDDTQNILEKYRDTIIVVNHGINKGKGYAIRTGLERTTGDLVIIQDADLEYDPMDFIKLIEPIVNDRADVVLGSRNLIPQPRGGAAYYWGGIFLTRLANLLFGIRITDEPTCYKLFRTELLKSINLKSKKFEFCPEVIAKVAKRKCRIAEVPISYKPRAIAEGKKIKWLDGIQATWTLFKYRFFCD